MYIHMTGTKFIQINVNYSAKGTHLCTICIQEQYNHSRPTWLIDISPFSDTCDGYFQRCDWYFQMLLVFSDLNHGLKAFL